MRETNSSKHQNAIEDEYQLKLDLVFVDITSEEACIADFLGRFGQLLEFDRVMIRVLYEATAQDAPRWYPRECPGGTGDPIIEAGYSGLQQATGGTKKQVRQSLKRLDDAGLIRRIVEPDIRTRDAARYQLIEGARRRRIFAQMQEAPQ